MLVEGRDFIMFSFRGSFKKKLFATNALLIIFIVVIIGFSVFSISRKIIINQVGHSRVEVLNQVAININIIKDGMLTVSSLYSFNDELSKIISGTAAKDEYDTMKDEEKLRELFSKYMMAFDNSNLRYDVIVYADNGFRFSTQNFGGYNFNSIVDRKWYGDLVKNDGVVLWVSTYNDLDGYGTNKYIFTIARVVKNIVTGSKRGVLLINVDEDVLFNTYKSTLSGDNELLIIDKAGGIVSSSEKESLGTSVMDQENIRRLLGDTKPQYFIGVENGKEILISSYFIPGVEWFIVEKIPLNVIFKEMSFYKYFLFGLLLVCMIVGLIVSLVIAKKITFPLSELCNSMKSAGDGNLKPIEIKSNTDEVNELGTVFNKMISKIKKLLENIRKEEVLKRKAEFDFLQQQINPHFLYNTLYTIKCMVSMDKKEQADHMMMSFMSLLRKIYSNREDLTSVNEELENLRAYVDIQRYRYVNRFNIIYNIEDQILEYKIPKLILQPIIENAIFHGIEPKQQKGSITISGREEFEHAIIDVFDDGIGMDKQTLKNILNFNSNTRGKSLNQIGVCNVNERLILHFGPSYGLKIDSEPGKGTNVRITIPYNSNIGGNHYFVE